MLLDDIESLICTMSHLSNMLFSLLASIRGSYSGQFYRGTLSLKFLDGHFIESDYIPRNADWRKRTSSCGEMVEFEAEEFLCRRYRVKAGRFAEVFVGFEWNFEESFN